MRELREARGWSQSVLPDAVRVSRQSVFAIETGRALPAQLRLQKRQLRHRSAFRNRHSGSSRSCRRGPRVARNRCWLCTVARSSPDDRRARYHRSRS
ncbi:MAG TPA: helix-turn-helix domain-containing protein [Polyangiaceae bacterium]|nr:helix-turn-helix domain-containing protein [Polyangiaceae bacterium]